MNPRNWPAEEVNFRDLAELVPYARNVRTHMTEQIDQISASMWEWGWTCPILVDESNTVIAGHARIEAARKLGWTEVPAVVARGWTEAQKKAYVLADNKLAENASWDREKLICELEEPRARFLPGTTPYTRTLGLPEPSVLRRLPRMIDPVYLPFDREQLRPHFTADGEAFERSSRRYRAFLRDHPVAVGISLSESKVPLQRTAVPGPIGRRPG